MSNRSLGLDSQLYGYYLDHAVREHPVLEALREQTAAHPMARMQIAPEQGQLMQLLITVSSARRCLEVGVFTGYSTIATALALPDDGVIIACDNDPQATSIAQEYFKRAAVQHKIDLRLGDAQSTLRQLVDDGEHNFDFAFIDADKENYQHYFDLCLSLLRPGGMIAVDNVLWGGRVADPNNNEIDTVAIREFNARLLKDERVDMVMLPIADGLTLAIKR